MTRRLLTSFGLSLVLMTIPAKSQFVKETFTDPLYSDNFETDAGNWKIQSNADNLFLIQEWRIFIKAQEHKHRIFCFHNLEIAGAGI
ncbi:MAG: hypothetical protein IPG90_09905 [Bacteroidetes bacterium]|nr:hypothetical protein [Bacteroidota bacterium]